MPVVVDHGAFRAHPPQGSATAAEIFQVRGGFVFHLDRAGRVQQLTKFHQRRGRAATTVDRAAEPSLLVFQSQTSDTTEVIDRKKEINGIERGRGGRLAGPPQLLPLLRVIPQDHPLRPAIGFCIGDDGMKNRTRTRSAPELRAGDQRQAGLQRETVRSVQPRGMVGKCGTLTGTDGIVMQRADIPLGVAEMHFDRAFHEAVGVFLTRTRFGSRCSSSSRPWSSRRTSATSPSTSPNPSTNSAIA